MKSSKIRTGQSILEVVIATTLISMGVLAALSLTNQSQKSSNYAKTLDAATAFNNQAADYIRNQKNITGFASLSEKFNTDKIGNSAVYCLNNLPTDATGFMTLDPGVCDDNEFIQGTSFTRWLEVDTANIATGLIPLTITTSWNDAAVRNAVLNMELSKWK